MIGNDWDLALSEEFEKDYFLKIKDFIDEEYKSKTIYPPYDEIFNAFKLTPLSNVKVVILGQDPYHEKGQAHGLAFSTPPGRPIPRSLKNIFKEINAEYGYPIPKSGCLESWANQGVFLLNTVLTVEEGNANSHSKCGWQTFTDNVIKLLPNHLVLITSHPSPFSARRGFLGSNHFIKANEFLSNNGLEEINWEII